LEIARCLVCEPLLILLDEPFAAVDPITTEDIRRNIRELADSGIGILITDHNVREVFRTADRVYLITEGQVVTKGTPRELVNDEIAIKAYLGRSFEEDGFTRHFAAQALRQAGEVLGGDKSLTNTPTATTAVAPPPRESASMPVDTPPPVKALNGSLSSTAGAILEFERLRQTVERLAEDQSLKAAMIELVARGEVTIPILLEALERREAVLRRRAFEVLKVVAKAEGVLNFDPEAPADVRLRQVAYLRVKLEPRR
jgi:lipopolysaccharide export system ATP-binding protein